MAKKPGKEAAGEGGGEVGDPPLTPAGRPEAAPGASDVAEVLPPPAVVERRRLPDTRQSVTKKITINHLTEEGPVASLDVYVTVGLYDDGTPGEIFVRAGKMGSTVSGLLDSVCICMSIGLQSGVPLEWYVTKLKGMKFEPEGQTNDPKIRRAGSMIDAIMRWLERRFITKED